MGRKLKRIRPAAAYVIAILAFVLICFVVGRIPTGDSISSSETSDSTQQDNSGLPWNLILVSNEIPLPENFQTPQLATLSDYRNEQVDARILQDLTTMLNDMEQAGLQPLVCSSYRDYNRQMQLFNQERDRFTEQGMDAEEAYAAAMANIALPGYSEHETGLAVDIVSVDHQTLDRDFADTPEGQWLATAPSTALWCATLPINRRLPASLMNPGIFGMWEGTLPWLCSSKTSAWKNI